MQALKSTKTCVQITITVWYSMQLLLLSTTFPVPTITDAAGRKTARTPWIASITVSKQRWLYTGDKVNFFLIRWIRIGIARYSEMG